MEKKEWVKIIEDNREGNVITGRRWDNQKMAWELDGRALNIVEFRGLMDEHAVGEHYNGDAKAWAKDYADFYPLDVDVVIYKALEGRK